MEPRKLPKGRCWVVSARPQVRWGLRGSTGFGNLLRISGVGLFGKLDPYLERPNGVAGSVFR